MSARKSMGFLGGQGKLMLPRTKASNRPVRCVQSQVPLIGTCRMPRPLNAPNLEYYLAGAEDTSCTSLNALWARKTF